MEKGQGSRSHYRINVGDCMPAFVVRDHEGFQISQEDVLGAPLVLFFYLKDDTTLSVQEVCAFREAIKEMDRYDTLVLGVSPDKMESHRRLVRDHRLNFTLLCDERFELAQKFDVLREGNKYERTTFVIDPDGVVRWFERPVSLEGHTKRVLEAVKKYSRVDTDLQRFIEENERLRKEFAQWMEGRV